MDPIPNDHQNAKAQAKAAKAYAKATRPWYKKKRWGLAAAVLVIIGATQAGGSEDPEAIASEPTASESTTGAKTPAKKKPANPEPEAQAVEVTAEAIVKEFGENELAADTKYKGKTLKISGVVDSIDTDLFDEEKYILALGGGGDFELFTVNCNDMSTDELATLNTGQTVTVVGQFDDGGDLGVEVSDCVLA